MVNRWGNSRNSGRLYFRGLQNHCRWWQQPWNKKKLTPWKESYDQPRQHIKKQRHYFANKGPSSQGYGFSSGHVWMWELDYKESWAPKNWSFWTVVLIESPLDCKEIQPVHPKGDQSWVLFGRTDVEAETPILWPPDMKSWLVWKEPDAGKDWRQEEKGMTEGDWIASPTQWRWVWVNSGSWWWVWPMNQGKLDVIKQEMARVNINIVGISELKWTGMGKFNSDDHLEIWSTLILSWRLEEKGMAEDELVGWHHRLDGREFEKAPGVGDGQGNLACYSPWGGRVRHYRATELNWP